MRREEGWGGLGWGLSGTQKFVFQKWPDQIFPMAEFVFTLWSLWSGGGLLLRLLAVRMHPWLYLQTMPPKGAEVITESIIAREGPFRQQSLRMELQGL